MSRRLARKGAFKVVFSINYTEETNIEELIEETLQDDNAFWFDENSDDLLLSLNKNDKKFYMELVKGTISNIDRINQLIKDNLKSWKINRIAKIDLAILQLAIFEILYRDDVPNSVAINEAVELGKEFGTNDSGGFINGVLGKIVRMDRSKL